MKNMFDKIIAYDVLEHIPNLSVIMKSCLDLLKVGEILEILVPYDLSLGAWQDPTHIRAFNENSWLYYSDWFWYLGWDEARFSSNTNVTLNLSKLGIELQNAGKSIEEIARTPRAVDSMLVQLKKVLLSEEDKKLLINYRGEPRLIKGEYCIWSVKLPGYIHNPVFDEIALGLKAGLTKLGFDVPVVADPDEITGKAIVLGGNPLAQTGLSDLPENIILFNLEQVQLNSPWMSVQYLDLLKSYSVWDYSRLNIKELEKLGVTDVTYCGIGYEPELTKIPQVQEDIDVLFYGSINERRKNVLEALKDKGLNVVALFGSYGDKRDEYIARAKIILNVHYYEARVFEIVRVSYLLANRKFVISETGLDAEFEKNFDGGIVFSKYENLVENCLKYLEEEGLRRQIAEKGFDNFKKHSQSDFLNEAVKT